MNEKFKIGEVVRIKSGGPHMTVSKNLPLIDKDNVSVIMVVCEYWNEAKKEPGITKFNQDMLELVK